MNSTKKLVLYALIIAIIILMAFTPLGYLKMPGVEITFLMIPVIIGAVVIGPSAGMVFGAVFGLTSFLQAVGIMGASQFGAALFSINPLYTFILCVVPRLLMGLFCGLIFRLFKSRKSVGACCAASFSGAALNTIFFMATLMLLFGNSEYIQGLRGGVSVLKFFVLFVGLNGLIEAIVATVVGTAVSKALLNTMKKTEA